MTREREKASIEGALVDAELFIKYRMPQRAIATLAEMAERYPVNADLRWRLAELYLDQRQSEQAAYQLLALADIYYDSQQIELARSALLKIKQIYPDAPLVNKRLAALDQTQPANNNSREQPRLISTLAGDLRYINLFDVIQAVEKNSITGIIEVVTNQQPIGSVYFNQGRVVDAIFADKRGKSAFKCFAEITEGFFELERSPVEFNPQIEAESNAQLILEIFADDEPEPSAQD